MLGYGEAAAECMRHFCDHDAHGYSQPRRWGDGSFEDVHLSDGSIVQLAGGDHDCSAGVIGIYDALGVPTGGASWTGDMLGEMLGTGAFTEVDVAGAIAGDVLWRTGHVELLTVHDGTRWQGGFRMSESCDVDGWQGDQTGWECAESAFDPSDWERCIRCTLTRGDELSDEEARKLAKMVAQYAAEYAYGESDHRRGLNQYNAAHWAFAYVERMVGKVDAIARKLGA